MLASLAQAGTRPPCISPIVSVCNRSRESPQRVAERFGIPTIYDRWQDLVTAPDTDAIVIGTWPYLHRPATLAALAAGKHVLCEARMAMNVQEARVMHDAACAHPQLVAQLVPAPQTLGVDATVQHLLTEQYLGQPLVVTIRDGNSFLNREAPRHWRQDVDLSGYNILTLGIWYEVLYAGWVRQPAWWRWGRSLSNSGATTMVYCCIICLLLDTPRTSPFKIGSRYSCYG